MDNNNIFRRLRYILGNNDLKMAEVFELAGHPIEQATVTTWLKKDDDQSFQPISDEMLATFLNGLIIQKRGKKEGPLPVAEKEINNNLIFKKLRIAFNLQSDDLLNLFKEVDTVLSPHELSAFFRKPTHSKYRECQDQYLRQFLSGLQLANRGV